MIITRSNDRRLHLTATDWVNTHVGQQGDLSVRHTRSRRTVRLPADYVRTSTGLGYAGVQPCNTPLTSMHRRRAGVHARGLNLRPEIFMPRV